MFSHFGKHTFLMTKAKKKKMCEAVVYEFI